MADVALYYKNNKIFETSSNAEETILTGGKYCEENISLVYDKPGLDPLTDPALPNDVNLGKEYYDDQGVAQTGSFVPPVDTGASGLYKAMIERTATEIVDDELTVIPSYSQDYNTNLIKVSLPNVTSVGSYAFQNCKNLTGVINLPSVINNNSHIFGRALRRTVVINISPSNAFQFIELLCNHIWMPMHLNLNTAYVFNGYANTNYTIQIDNCSALNLLYSNAQNGNLSAIIFRQNTLIPLSSVGALSHSSNFHFYVPTSLLNDYKTGTNWTTYANYFVGIDEDTTCSVGTAFTPTTTATGIVSWDQVDLQSYSVGTIDTTTGAITTTTDGRLLIRGLDASDNILHVTYLQIGTGFNEEANLA